MSLDQKVWTYRDARSSCVRDALESSIFRYAMKILAPSWWRRLQTWFMGERPTEWLIEMVIPAADAVWPYSSTAGFLRISLGQSGIPCLIVTRNVLSWEEHQGAILVLGGRLSLWRRLLIVGRDQTHA